MEYVFMAALQVVWPRYYVSCVFVRVDPCVLTLMAVVGVIY